MQMQQRICKLAFMEAKCEQPEQILSHIIFSEMFGSNWFPEQFIQGGAQASDESLGGKRLQSCPRSCESQSFHQQPYNYLSNTFGVFFTQLFNTANVFSTQPPGLCAAVLLRLGQPLLVHRPRERATWMPSRGRGLDSGGRDGEESPRPGPGETQTRLDLHICQRQGQGVILGSDIKNCL